jgi:predicted lipid-binding transport protein (Tim44 family)
MGNGNDTNNPPKKPEPGAGSVTDNEAGKPPAGGTPPKGGIKPLDDDQPPQNRLLRAARNGGAMGGFVGGLIGGLIGACLCCFLHH